MSDQAVAAVRAIWAQVGAAVEEIRRDYGEDLLVQTARGPHMDPERLWIQVKGTQQAKKGLPTSISLPNRTLLRWLRMPDMVVLVSWNVHSHTGWFALPQRLVSMSELSADPDGNSRLDFHPDDSFDEAGAKDLVRQVRLDRLVKDIRAIKGEIAHILRDEDYPNPDRLELLQGNLMTLGIYGLVDYGVLAECEVPGRFSFPDDFLDLFRRTLDENQAQDEHLSEMHQLANSMALSMLHKAGYHGIPVEISDDLLGAALSMMVGLVEKGDPKYFENEKAAMGWVTP